MVEFIEEFKSSNRPYYDIQVDKSEVKFTEFMKNNQIVIEMIDRSTKDYDFKKQMQTASKETKEFINAIVNTFEVIELKRHQNRGLNMLKRMTKKPL